MSQSNDELKYIIQSTVGESFNRGIDAVSGNIYQFQDCIFSNANWNNVKDWAFEQDCKIAILNEKINE